MKLIELKMNEESYETVPKEITISINPSMICSMRSVDIEELEQPELYEKVHKTTIIKSNENTYDFRAVTPAKYKKLYRTQIGMSNRSWFTVNHSIEFIREAIKNA